MSFRDLGLSEEVLRALDEKGYSEPTPIQRQAIPHVLMGRDLLGVAQTGTGKTASFTLPMIDILAQGRARARMPRSLIIEPTRELATQVADNFEVYGKYHKLSMALLIGGESFVDQERNLDRGVDVLIATPGRLLDLFERGRILLTDVKILVIDEADRMLDMGFIPDVERIVSLVSRNRQTLFFSATMAPEIRRIADAFLTDPKEISVAPPATASATVTQCLAVVEELDKREALRRLLRAEDVKNALIFCNRKRDVEILFKSLQRHGFSVARLHGDMVQSSRTETLEGFKKGDFALMVCSDVAARGIDISGLSHVFNFDVPMHSEDYVHRIGRTGRAGREGRAITLATPDDTKFVTAIERLVGKDIPRLSVPDMDPLELLPEGEAEGAKRGRGRERGRGRDKTRDKGRSRGRGRERAREPQAEDASQAVAENMETAATETNDAAPEMAAVAPPEQAENRLPREPREPRRRERSDRSEHSDRSDKKRHERSERPHHHARDKQDRYRQDHRSGRDFDRDPSPIGFGDDIPAFMLIVPQLRPLPPLPEEERGEEESSVETRLKMDTVFSAPTVGEPASAESEDSAPPEAPEASDDSAPDALYLNPPH